MSETHGEGVHEAAHGAGAHGDAHGHHEPPPPGADRMMWPWVLAALLGWATVFAVTWWLASFW